MYIRTSIWAPSRRNDRIIWHRYYARVNVNPYITDFIFGTLAKEDDWTTEIKSRIKEVEYKIQGLGVKFQSKYSHDVKTGMMVRSSGMYNLIMDNGNEWSNSKIPLDKSTITKSELEKIYEITIQELLHKATFKLV